MGKGGWGGLVLPWCYPKVTCCSFSLESTNLGGVRSWLYLWDFVFVCFVFGRHLFPPLRFWALLYLLYVSLGNISYNFGRYHISPLRLWALLLYLFVSCWLFFVCRAGSLFYRQLYLWVFLIPVVGVPFCGGMLCFFVFFVVHVWFVAMPTWPAIIPDMMCPRVYVCVCSCVWRVFRPLHVFDFVSINSKVF